MTIQIKDRDIQLKYGFRALMLYEKITQKTFAPQGISDILIFFYAVILASDREISLTFDDFIEVVDANPLWVADFSNWLSNALTKNAAIKSEVSEAGNAEEVKKNF